MARERISFRGCRRASAGLASASAPSWAAAFNEMVRRGELSADRHRPRPLDSGSVSSPNRETEAMKDGSDAVSDWPLLNALLNTASGAFGFPCTTAAASVWASPNTPAW